MSTLTGAYAVDALTGEERDEFERHLDRCEDCAQEARELRETAALLGADATTTAPEGLKQRVLGEIAHTRQLTPRAKGSQAKNVRVLRPRGWAARLAVAAAAVGVALAAALGGYAWHTQQQLADLTEQVARSEHGAEMARLLQAPDAHIMRATVAGAPATTVVSRDMHQVMFLSSNLPSVPPGRAYQLWFISGGKPSSAGMVPPAGNGRTAAVMAPMPADAGQMALTVEPASGSSQPTTNPVMVMQMPA